MKYTIIILSLFLVGCGGKYSDEDITFLSCEYESYDDEYSYARDELSFALFNNSSEKFSLLINKTRKLVVFADTRSLVSVKNRRDSTLIAFLNEEIEKTAWSAKEITPYRFNSFHEHIIEWEEQIEGGGNRTVSNTLNTNRLTLSSEYFIHEVSEETKQAVSLNNTYAMYKCVKLDKEIEHMPDWELGEQNRL